MRIVFMGTPDFAVASLKSLIENNFNVVAVVTMPDKPAGRGQLIHQSAVKKYALETGLKLLQPENLKNQLFIEELRNLHADIQIVVAFRMLPEVVWSMPKHGTYNIHASLLPKYRGAAPINWAIINGEEETGVTIFKLKHAIDTGDILCFEKVKIGLKTTAGELHDTLMLLGARLIVEALKRIQYSSEHNTKVEFIKQEEASVCHAPKLYKEMCKINWNEPLIEIYNKIRGLSPYPTAYTEIKNKSGSSLTIKLFNSEIEQTEHNNPLAEIITDGKRYIKIACKGGYIDLTDVQLQGKKRMSVSEFLRGFKIEEYMIL